MGWALFGRMEEKHSVNTGQLLSIHSISGQGGACSASAAAMLRPFRHTASHEALVESNNGIFIQRSLSMIHEQN
jgi:hypothetical protein